MWDSARGGRQTALAGAGERDGLEGELDLSRESRCMGEASIG